MVRFINDKLQGIAQGTSASDGVRFDQLDTYIRSQIKRSAIWHGSVVTGTLIPVANGTTIIDQLDPSPPSFYPILVAVRQTSAGSLTLGGASITVGTNAPNYNNIMTISSVTIAGLQAGGILNLLAGSTGVSPLPASSNIGVRVNGLVIGTSITLGIDILGAYR